MKQKFLWTETGWVALGGMIGASLRHGTNQLVTLVAGESQLITATAIENIAGCFLIGAIFTLLKTRADKNRQLSLFLLTGIIGSFTTYSGFMLEAFLISGESFLLTGFYLFIQIFIGLISLFTGILLAKRFF